MWPICFYKDGLKPPTRNDWRSFFSPDFCVRDILFNVGSVGTSIWKLFSVAWWLAFSKECQTQVLLSRLSKQGAYVIVVQMFLIGSRWWFWLCFLTWWKQRYFPIHPRNELNSNVAKIRCHLKFLMGVYTSGHSCELTRDVLDKAFGKEFWELRIGWIVTRVIWL